MDYHSATHPPHSLDPYDIPDHYNQGHPWPDDHTQSHNPAFHYTPPYEQDWLPSHHDRPLSYHELVALGQQPIVNFGSTLWDALLEPERPRVPSLAYSPPDKPPDQTWYLSGCDVRAMPQSAWSAAYGGTSDVQDGVRDADACHPGLGHNVSPLPRAPVPA
ncbi:hypothetical protein OE88DRAFT_1697015 [Heliocybe sulcata]|uniref:Uncharacterized protein n=1 Tax=Heliocybe sulcata TaxID=5364 RepID=A0A5C3N4L7_9AGAM|nr:hypothetical protein OE88DRAFT_1697015 [Heliocybe sulcata]